MPLLGKQLMMRDVAREARKREGEDWGWLNYELTKELATVDAESRRFLGAYHDNVVLPEAALMTAEAWQPVMYARYGPPLDAQDEPLRDVWIEGEGEVVSRDCGIEEFNIPAADIGGPVEWALRTESMDEAEWRPVFENSIRKAWDYYMSPWTRDGKKDIRRFQAWYGYTTGWAMFPYSWVWHRDKDGKPVGPWVKTGRYVFTAIAGQMNNLVVNEKLWTPEQALYYAKRYATHFGITDDQGTLGLGKDNLGNAIVKWTFPKAPIDPPADGKGPYPETNDGV